MIRLKTYVTTLALCLVAAAPAFAAGSSRQSVPETPEPVKTPEQTAVEEFNTGLRYRDRALAADEKANEATADKKRLKAEKKRDGMFEAAVRHFQNAVSNKHDYYQAYGSLGYALRRLGRYEEAMTAYDIALQLNPNYPEAMEYRAEALLGLGRLDAAREAYDRLAAMDSEYAGQLLEAVRVWAADENNAEMAAAAELSAWIEERAEVLTTASGAVGSDWN